MAWKKKSEALNPLCNTKGKRATTGGRMAHFMVALSPGGSVALCLQYQGRLDGKRFGSMVQKIFPDVSKKFEQWGGCLFLQDGCPMQNSSAALKAMKKVKADVFSVPPRRPDLNPIEKFFNSISKKLNDDAVEMMMVNLQLEITALKKLARSSSQCPPG